MKKFAVLILIAFAVASNGEHAEFIVGGRNAAHGQFPHMASLRYNPDLVHGCGGAIINTRWVLSVKSWHF